MRCSSSCGGRSAQSRYSPVPVIFGLTGHCPAGGTVLAIHGDYRVLALGRLSAGTQRSAGGTVSGSAHRSAAFRRLVGGHAAQLLTRGALIDPSTALRVGLVDELCEASQVSARALEVAREFCALPREPMLRTRALARQDLLELFGNPGHAALEEREFATIGTWISGSSPATQAATARGVHEASSREGL